MSLENSEKNYFEINELNIDLASGSVRTGIRAYRSADKYSSPDEYDKFVPTVVVFTLSSADLNTILDIVHAGVKTINPYDKMTET